jgi:PIN domain nuclease of toxin-antitoxin system
MLLLDTHTLLWWLADDARLGVRARRRIADPGTPVLVSAATAWEVAIKRALGRLRAPENLRHELAENDFAELPITVEHALGAGALPRHHDDPFDRMLVYQCLAQGLRLVTADRRLSAYGVTILAADS